MPDDKKGPSEWATRKQRIDPKLKVAGWSDKAGGHPHWVAEHPTEYGPADYVLMLDGKPTAIIEGKKLTVGPQNVLTQAERYSKGLKDSRYDFNGHRVPFLYSTNGEVTWFHDVRHPLSRSRKIPGFHTPNALREMLTRDFEGACESLQGYPNEHPMLRPYQRDANIAIEKAIAERKHHMLVAMATGTGKTFTMVNEIYRLMKTQVAKRVLFLVDRRALAAQAVKAFASWVFISR